MNILTNSNFTNNGGPTIVETVNRRIFNEHEKVNEVQPLYIASGTSHGTIGKR